jgi:hypothetical protein
MDDDRLAGEGFRSGRLEIRNYYAVTSGHAPRAPDPND